MKFAVLLAGLLLASPASADVASAQIQALWAKVATVPELVGVDQIVFEGDTGAVMVRGVFEKRSWLNATPTYQSKRFNATIARKCFEDKPECFVVTGIWSNGSPIALAE